MKTYINRSFKENEIPSHLHFDLKLGDVITLDGRVNIITGYGIYDNQMWTEKIYENGCHIGAGDYEVVKAYMLVTNQEVIQSAIKAYKEELIDTFNEFLTKHYTEEQLNSHLEQF